MAKKAQAERLPQNALEQAVTTPKPSGSPAGPSCHSCDHANKQAGHQRPALWRCDKADFTALARVYGTQERGLCVDERTRGECGPAGLLWEPRTRDDTTV